MARVGLSKKLRFEVFKRDSFACQYCGRKAPEVVLQCDHITPVAEGGTNDILNLVTSCVDCNSGKGARSLSEQATLNKQMDQLAELQARREQIEMLMEWRRGLSDIQKDTIDHAVTAWEELIEERATVSKTGRDRIRKWIKEHGLELVLRAMGESLDSYGKRDSDDRLTFDSVDFAFNKIGAVARVLRDSAEKPYLKRVFYIRGILRGRLHCVDEKAAFRLMDEAGQLDVDFDSLENLARRVRNWSAFRDALERYIEEHGATKK